MQWLRGVGASIWVAVVCAVVTFVAAGQVQATTIPGALYAVNSGIGGQFLMTLDKTTGAVTTIGSTGLVIDGMTIDPNGVMYAADNAGERLVTLDPMTGALDLVIGSTGFGILEGLAARPTDGALFAIDLPGDQLLSLNTGTGAATPIGGFGTTDSIAGLSFSNDGLTLYAMGHTSGSLYTINQSTGAATFIGSSGQTSGPLALAVDRATDSLFMSDWTGGNSMNFFSIDSTSAAATFIGSSVGANQIEGMSFAPIPEPSTGLLLALGLLGAAVRRRV